MISHDAFGLDEDLVDHRVTMVTVHFMDAMLVKLGQRQQHPQGQSLGLLTVAQLHRLDMAAEPEVADRKERWRAKKKRMNVNNAGQRMQLCVASNLKTLFYTVPATVIVFSQKQWPIFNFVFKKGCLPIISTGRFFSCSNTDMNFLSPHRWVACGAVTKVHFHC